MTMPLNLVLVRHGESEGNVANRRGYAGDNSAFTAEFRSRPSANWRLTDVGIAQAQAAGRWLRENYERKLNRLYVSNCLRAMETATHLGLDGNWFVDYYLRERDWGMLDVMSHSERHERFSDEMARRKRDGFFFAPPGGESMANLCERADRVLGTLHRECEHMDVLMTCHGEMMTCLGFRIERPLIMAETKWNSDDPLRQIHNCQIIQYSRVDPFNHGVVANYVGWKRSICPWDPSLSTNEWQEIHRPTFSADDLRRLVEAHPRMIASE